jgi:cyclic beta-1,2-glucan synthetase
MYRLIVETLLGIDRRGATLALAPRLPAEWPGCRLHYRYGDSVYTIAVRRGETQGLVVDGASRDGNAFTLVDDGRPHTVELCLPGHGDAATAAQDASTACQK